MKNFKRFFLGMLVIAGIVGMIAGCKHSVEEQFQGRVWKGTENDEIFFWEKGTDNLYFALESKNNAELKTDILSAKKLLKILKISGNNAMVAFTLHEGNKLEELSLVEVKSPTPAEIKAAVKL